MDARVDRDRRLPEDAFRWSSLIALVLIVLATTGCTRDQLAYQTALPGTASAASIEWLGERSVYLDVRVDTAGKQLRFFLPAAAADCAALKDVNGEVSYANSGVLGRLDSGALHCEPVGILSLDEWRSRRPRSSREPVPRARATWRVIYRDADLVLARGRFVLAAQLGWSGGADTVAVFAVDPECAATLERGVGSLEYRPSGSDVLALVGADRRCPLLGLARPIP